jgi:hypothetical protein
MRHGPTACLTACHKHGSDDQKCSRSQHSAPVVVGTRCLRARPDDVFEDCPVARSLLRRERSGVSIRTIVAASTARGLSSARTSAVVGLVAYVPCTSTVLVLREPQ